MGRAPKVPGTDTGADFELMRPSVPVARIVSCAWSGVLSGASFGSESRAPLTFNNFASVYVSIVSRISE